MNSVLVVWLLPRDAGRDVRGRPQCASFMTTFRLGANLVPTNFTCGTARAGSGHRSHIAPNMGGHRAIEPVLLEPAIQLSAGDPKLFSRSRLVAGDFAQSLRNRLSL